MSSIVVYPISIQKIQSNQEISSTFFSVLDHKISGRALLILIEYQARENPEVEAFWDEIKDKFYLVGGAIDPPKAMRIGRYTCAKTYQAWLSLDLSPLKKPSGEFKILQKIEYCEVEETHAHHRLIRSVKEALLLKVQLPSEG